MKNIKNLILEIKPNCSLCGKPANKVHSFLIRNKKIRQVKDCIPTCLDCEKDILLAIEYEYISQNPKEIENIKEKTINLLNDEQFTEFKNHLLEKRYLTSEEKSVIERLTKVQMRKLSGLLKRDIWYNKLSTEKFSEKEIFQIYKLIKTFKYRAVV